MANMTFKIDAAAIAASFKEEAAKVEKELTKAVEDLASQTYAKTKELAEEGLRGSKYKDASGNTKYSLYSENLKFESMSTTLHIVSLDDPALWVEDGRPEFDMKPGLLKGRSHVTIPFKYGKDSGKLSKTQQALKSEIEERVKDVNVKRQAEGLKPISLHKTEKSGKKAIVGKMLGPEDSEWKKLHTFDFSDNSQSKHFSWIGKKGGKDTHALTRVNIYQKMEKGNIRRDIVAFRTISRKSKPDSWIMPASEGKKFMDKAFEWAEKRWETTMLPEITQKWENKT